ncbi:hypothetical protein MMC25_005448 [Agyrium rufum]|nr:hypothetical protein [Agyrium rufum]
MRRSILPPSAATSWAKLYNVDLNGVELAQMPGDRGCGLLTSSGFTKEEPVLMTVPRNLLLSLNYVWECAKSDSHLHELLQAMGDYARTSRGAILLFLLVQIAVASPDMETKIGTSGPWSEYVRLLPSTFTLPTFWTEAERELFEGTSLKAAVSAKLDSLNRENERLQDAVATLKWGHRWIGAEKAVLTFDDWRTVDAMYRSRALDLPGTGHAMVPYLDMANHASDDSTTALYETDSEGNAVLLLRDGKLPDVGDEITITYGDDKGACEMLFSYGFLEDDMQDAREVFLDLDIPNDDPLKLAKKVAFETAPGVKLFSRDGKVGWDGLFVYLCCVNEEDGLEFRVLLQTDGETMLSVSWNDEQVRGVEELQECLRKSSMWDLFQLRANQVIQMRIQGQLQILQSTSELREADEFGTMDEEVKKMARKLADLEEKFLIRANEYFEKEKTHLIENSETIKHYLASLEPEDFS